MNQQFDTPSLTNFDFKNSIPSKVSEQISISCQHNQFNPEEQSLSLNPTLASEVETIEAGYTTIPNNPFNQEQYDSNLASSSSMNLETEHENQNPLPDIPADVAQNLFNWAINPGQAIDTDIAILEFFQKYFDFKEESIPRLIKPVFNLIKVILKTINKASNYYTKNMVTQVIHQFEKQLQNE